MFGFLLIDVVFKTFQLGLFNIGRQVFLVQPPDEDHKSHTISTAPHVKIRHDDGIDRPLTGK